MEATDARVVEAAERLLVACSAAPSEALALAALDRLKTMLLPGRSTERGRGGQLKPCLDARPAHLDDGESLPTAAGCDAAPAPPCGTTAADEQQPSSVPGGASSSCRNNTDGHSEKNTVFAVAADPLSSDPPADPPSDPPSQLLPQLLVDAVNLRDPRGGTPLLYAVLRGWAGLTSRLLAVGASATDCRLQPSCNGPLHLAALQGDVACTRELVRDGPNRVLQAVAFM